LHAPSTGLADGISSLQRAFTVRTGSATYTYHAADIRRGELWSRIAAGDTLEFVLSVPAISQESAVFEISSFQAGFRAFRHSILW
jgi:hypothetical protein